MTSLRFTALLVGLCLGCNEVSFPDCEEKAMKTADGEVDECDLQACEAAFGDGCRQCITYQSRPPIYVGDDGEEWTVFDFCPDWGMDTGSES